MNSLASAASVLALATAAAIARSRTGIAPPKPNHRDPHGCWSCGANAIIRDPRAPHTVRCGACGATRQILVELPSVQEQVARERAVHGGGPREVRS